jgi:hypothetical protein
MSTSSPFLRDAIIAPGRERITNQVRSAFGAGHLSGGGGSILYIVEVAIDAANLAHELSQMRTWLDHMRSQAIGFRQIPGANICRVDFQDEQEARAFAQAFAGLVLNHTAG